MASPDPCLLVIFGASGDLARVKLIPAIYALAREKLLPDGFALLGYARTEMSDDEFRQRFADAVRKGHDADDGLLDDLLSRVYYQTGQYDDEKDFGRLRKRLDELDHSHGTKQNRLFYLSTPPNTFAPIVRCLGQSKLLHRQEGQEPGGAGHPDPNGTPGSSRPARPDAGQEGNATGWGRVVVEKPFGFDLQSARKLNAQLYETIAEEQIYRIDHYLGKELVQNLMVLRFANGIFEPVWNHRYVDHIQITVAESVSADERGGYYDASGALRDMVQNHILQLMALIAMEPPVGLDARSTRDEKVKVFKSIRPVQPEAARTIAVRGQYSAGEWSEDGKKRKTDGYRSAKGVDPDSTTETFAALKLYVDNWRWNGMPFYIRTGKCLPEKVSEIAIRFKRPPLTLFQKQCESPVYPNDLIIHVAPEEGISLRVNGKVPGSTLSIRGVSFQFNYADTFQKEPPEAYERLIADAMAGDQTLFIRGDEVEAAWQVVDPILKGWRRLDEDGKRPAEYQPGTWGPGEASALIEKDHRSWLHGRDEPEPVIACSL